MANYDDSFAGAGRRVYILDVSNPSAMTVAGSFQVAASDSTVNLWGIAIKPDGTRLYVGDRYNYYGYYKVCVYNIAGANRTSPQHVTDINLGTTKNPTYLAVNTDGNRLFVKVDETADPGDGARKDVEMYDISGPTPVLMAEVYKITGNNYRSYLPGDHLPTGNDLDTRNGSEGMALSPNGWFMYFSNFNGPSGDGSLYYRDTLYGSSIANLTNGFDRTNPGDIWVSWGGCTQESPAIWSGWHSSDGIIATRNNKVYFTYSDVSVTPEYLSVPTTTDANIPPTAPKITYPLPQATNVSGFITWEPSLDDGIGPHGLTYTVETIEASTLEGGTTAWNHMAYTATGEVYTPLIGVKPGGTYYARVQAFDGTYTSPWSYTGPFTMDANFLLPPTWESSYLITSREAVIDWASVAAADSYIIQYRITGEATWHSTSAIASTYRYNSTDPNPNYRLTNLTPSATYEVNLIAVRSGVKSVPSSKPYVSFYTLEEPWVSHARVTSTEAYILWGPEVSTLELNVPNAVNYECWYRIQNAPVDWTRVTWPSGKQDSTTMTVLNAKLSGLTASTTYEVRMRTVDAYGGRSLWSPIHDVYTMERPWVSHAKVTSTEAYILWGPEESTSFNIPNAASYQYQYMKKTDTSWTTGPEPLSKRDDGTMPVLNFKLSNLTASTTYEVQMRALDVYGRTSDWSATDEVYTLESPWVSHAKTSTNESYILWGSSTSFEVRNATTYEARARITSSASWDAVPIKGVPRYNRDDGTMSPTLNIKLSSLLGFTPIVNTTYEVRMRARNAGGASDWSATNEVYVLGTPWVSAAKVTSKEAYILWGPVGETGLDVTGATSYQCWYRVQNAPVDWTKVTWPVGKQDDRTMATLNAKLSGLTASTTYEVQMRAVGSGGYSDWSPIYDVFTFERPWVNHANVKATEAYILWGPEESASLNIPNAASYVYQYRKPADTSWTSGPEPLSKQDDGTMPVLNFKLTGLTALTTYEVQMKALDSIGRSSDWSATNEVFTLECPWVSHAKTSTNEAYILWGSTTSFEVINATTYEAKARIASSASWASIPSIGVPRYNRDDATMSPTLNIKLSKLLGYAPTTGVTYEVIMRADGPGGYSDWSATHEVFMLESPWVGHAKVATNEAIILWGATTSFEVQGATSYQAMACAKNGAWQPIVSVPNFNIDDGTISPTATSMFNIKLSKLLGSAPTLNTTYEVMMRAVGSAGYSDWSATHEVYILGAPWVSHANVTATQEYVLWGPIGQSGLNVTGAVSYEYQYKRKIDTSWIGGSEPLSKRDNILMSCLNFRLTGLTASTTYDVQVRSVGTYGRSDWSATDEVYTLESPWVSYANITTNEASILWGSTSSFEVINAATYEAKARIQGGASWDTISSIGVPRYNRDDPTMAPTLNIKLSKLLGIAPTSGVTYEVIMRADNAGGVSDWSATAEVFMIGTPWVSHAKVSSKEAYVLWGPIGQSGLDVTGASSYECRYRIKGAQVPWTTKIEPLGKQDDPTMPVLNFELSNLTPSTTYQIQMRADGTGGNSGWSATDEVYTLETPWVNHANVKKTEAYIIWGSISGGLDVPNAAYYKYQYKKLSSAVWMSGTQPLGMKDDPSMAVLNFRLAGLTASTSYEVQMKAVDALGGESDWSAIDYFITIQGPWWIDVSHVTGTSALISWDNTAPGVTQYDLRYSTAPSAELGTAVLTTDAQLAVTGLSTNTQYYAKVRAITAAGPSSWTSVAPFFTNPVVGPSWIAAFNTTTTATMVTWEGVSGATSYEVNYGINTMPMVWTSWAPSPQDQNYGGPITGLNPRTWYNLRVKLHSGASASEWSPTALFYTIPAPTGVTQIGSTVTTATITWEPVDMGGGTPAPAYEISWGVDATASGSGDAVTGNINYTMTGLTTGLTYYVTVRARESSNPSDGYSDWSPYPALQVVASGTMGPVAPAWSSHYLVTSNEAVVNWGSVALADHYIVQYKKLTDATWASVEVLSTYQYNTADTNPNCQLTNLSPTVTYQVRVISEIGALQSFPSNPPDTFYTLERPWVDTYKPDSTQIYVTWGPEVNTSEVAVPLADHYLLQYSQNGGTSWTTYSAKILDNTVHDDATNLNLNILLSGLITNSTYEVQMRTVDSTGGLSDWSAIKTFHTIRAPWWIDATITGADSANIFWDNVSAPQYELRYSHNPSAEGAGMTVVTTTDAKCAVAGLDVNSTYYAKVRALTVAGASDWSPIKMFGTLPGPTWISNYLTTTTSTSFTWEGVAGTYEVSYGTNTDASGTLIYPFMPTDPFITGITGLTPKTWYHAKVRAYSSGSVSSWSPIDDFFTIPAPNNVAWTGSTITTASITWEPVDLGGTPCTSYEVSWSLTPEVTGSVSIMTKEVYSTISGLTTGSTYYVKVRARDDADSGYSSWAPYPPLTIVATDQATINDVNAGYGVTGGWRGTTVMIEGMNFGSTMGTVSFGSTVAQPGYWKNNEIAVSVPPTAVSGPNAITVVTNAGVTATSVPSTFFFTVTDGGVVLDDFEGGAWQFSTCEVGPLNSVSAVKNYTNPQERNTYLTVECNGTAAYEIVGGVTPYGDQPTENGIDISSCKQIKLWFKGDGSTNIATFELGESNMAPGNNPTNPNAAEIWAYNVPISMSNTNWQQITINLTTEGAGSFAVTNYWPGDGVLELNMIKSYQILTSGGNPKSYAVDYIFATTEAGGGPGTVSYNLQNNASGNVNWVAFPYTGSGYNTTTDLAAAIGNTIPIGSRTAWVDVVEVNVWDATAQSQTTYQSWWDGTIWNDLGSNANLVVGDMYTVTVPSSANGNAFSINGNTPASGSVSFTLQNNASGNVNWMTIPAYLSGIVTTTDLATSIGNKIPIGSRTAWVDVVEVNVWDPVAQSQTTYQSWWDGTIWNDLGSNTAVVTPGAYKVTVPSSANGLVWP